MGALDVFFHYANVTRYLSGAGLVVLVYDHILTLPSEISLIWPAPASYAKYIFLFNRYLVPASLLTIAWEMNHFSGESISDENLFTVIAMFSVISLGMANILVLLWVANLWDRGRTVVWMLTIGFIISTGTSSTMMMASLVELREFVTFSPLFSMCVLAQASPKLIVVWGAPMLFEVVVLVATWWNALSVPRQANMPLRSALHRDGVTFFMALTLFRTVNLCLSATRRPELVMMAVFLVWSMTTLVLSRSLLRLQRAENLQLVLNDLIDLENTLSIRGPSRHTWSDVHGVGDDCLYRSDSKFFCDGEEIELYRLG